MKSKLRFIGLFACAVLLFGESPISGAAADCLLQVQMSAQPGFWGTFKDYLASLSPADPASKRRSRLIRLRAEIITYESAKQELIEIVEAHIRSRTSRVVVSTDLHLSRIPDALARIARITEVLISISQEGDLFAAEQAFKELRLTFDAKRASTLCRLDEQTNSPAPDMEVMEMLLKELKDELKAISAADDALGDYIKKSRE